MSTPSGRTEVTTTPGANTGTHAGTDTWHIWSAVPPASGSAVMATGIISVGLHVAGFEVLSLILMWVAAAAWVFLASLFATRLVRDPKGWKAGADTPPALTAVAATAVLGTRLATFGWTEVATVLLVIAVVAWPVLLVAVILHWGRHMPGAAFLVCVATQGLAILCATLAPDHGDWLLHAALALFLLGLVLYVDALVRFDFGQVVTGAGDHWVAGGAMAISGVAGAKLLGSGLWSGSAHTALRTATLTIVGIALAWYAVLAVAEFVRPRFRYDIRRWATVFPLGMTAAAALMSSAAADVAWLDTLGRILLWIAVVVWSLTLIGFIRSLMRRAETT